jgi:hypothetical protein
MKTASTSNRMNKHGYHIKAHAEASPGVAYGNNAALIRSQLHGGVAVPADKPRGDDHEGRNPKRDNDMQEERKILPVVGNHCSLFPKKFA